MPAYLFHSSAVAQCTHAGSLSFTPGNKKVLVGGISVATAADVFTINACPFQVGSKKQPCMTATLASATKVKVNGSPAILSVGSSVCKSAEQAPQGPAMITSTQTKVTAI